MTRRRPTKRGKRVFDIAASLVAIVLTSPIFVLVALTIRATSTGPLLFRQRRTGLNGSTFDILKFRTMRAGSNPRFPDAKRITPIGHVLRRASLDELPQLFNVLRGDMSLVGPRPALPDQVERMTTRQRQRLAVRPGMTGLAQVIGRNQLSWTQRIEIDLLYVERQSLSLDLAILCRTPWTVLSGRGAGGHPLDDPIAADLSGLNPE